MSINRGKNNIWFKWFKNYPTRYKAMDRGIGYAFALLGAATGLIWFIAGGFKNFEALILTGVSVAIFFLIRMLTKNTIIPECEESGEDESEESAE